ncbi:exonuclease domain-containing protein, partial [Haematococcus lacustris]
MDLEDVSTTRSQARARVKALLLQSVRNGGPPSVLVGHALHHDLRALRLDHLPFIDTSLIFSY